MNIRPKQRREVIHMRAIVIGLLFIAAGCASRGADEAYDVGPWPVASGDSTRIADVNQRILTSSLASAGSASVPDQYRIGAHDAIEIEVFGVETFSGTFRVEDTGDVALPLLGSVEAAGNTTRELEELIETRLRETFMKDPHVTVHVSEVLSHGVSVIGSVRQPGVYQVTGRSTLLEVLALAEGLTEGAGNTVFVVRPASDRVMEASPRVIQDSLMSQEYDSLPRSHDGEVFEVDLGRLLEYGGTDANLEVLPGDIVQVRPAGLVYVVGEVNRPGGFTIPPGAPMTVLQALAMAEGLGGTANADGAVIVRQAEDGSRHELPISLEEVLDGSIPPPPLRPRDVLFVPKNGSKAFGMGVVNALVGMVTFRGLFY
jgi:polysaccharide export outer membrane protein